MMTTISLVFLTIIAQVITQLASVSESSPPPASPSAAQPTPAAEHTVGVDKLVSPVGGHQVAASVRVIGEFQEDSSLWRPFVLKLLAQDGLCVDQAQGFGFHSQLYIHGQTQVEGRENVYEMRLASTDQQGACPQELLRPKRAQLWIPDIFGEDCNTPATVLIKKEEEEEGGNLGGGDNDSGGEELVASFGEVKLGGGRGPAHIVPTVVRLEAKFAGHVAYLYKQIRQTKSERTKAAWQKKSVEFELVDRFRILPSALANEQSQSSSVKFLLAAEYREIVEGEKNKPVHFLLIYEMKKGGLPTGPLLHSDWEKLHGEFITNRFVNNVEDFGVIPLTEKKSNGQHGGK